MPHKRTRTVRGTHDEYLEAQREAQYASDMRHEALCEAVAQALMNTCYGDGSWDRIAHRPEGQGQRMAFMMQARAAVAVVEKWTQ